MAKLPTTFTTLDLQGFDIDRAQQYAIINREMLDLACAVLQRNRIGIATRSVQAALKHIYGIGGSADTICQLLREWRTDNLAALKQNRGEKDLVSAILEGTDDGLLDDSDIPEDYLLVMRQMAVAGYKLAYQKADTSVSGDRMKTLAAENDLMKLQLKDFPKLEFQLNFYKAEYDRQQNELREAYMNLNKQQLADSDNFRQQLDSLHQERNDLVAKLSEAEKRLSAVADLESKERERTGEISRLNGQLEAQGREISSQHEQIQSLQAQAGEKQVLESQLATIQGQLNEANETITRLQGQVQQKSAALQVDVDVDGLIAEKESLAKKVGELEAQVAEFQRVPATNGAKKNGKTLVGSSK